MTLKNAEFKNIYLTLANQGSAEQSEAGSYIYAELRGI